jgi:hypothetical protein
MGDIVHCDPFKVPLQSRLDLADYPHLSRSLGHPKRQ